MPFQLVAGLSPYPYPGLRAFQKSEADIFFGRDQQIDQVLEKLDRHRFLAILGPSGCGKSSLVRAGLIPALETGFMARAGYQWRTTIMRPGESPSANLATALFDDRICHADHDSLSAELAFVQATLKRGPLGLVEVLQQNRFPEEENLLLLVDQFEELFRFEGHGGRSESRAFVDLLVASAEHPEPRIYVVMTMRSEFLGRCPVFRGLPEAMNDSQFLTPRLTRDQIRDAIVGPASMFNTDVAPEVVARILNAMGTDPDQLPLMQHLLMRMWRRAALNLASETKDGEKIGEDSRQTWDTLRGLDELQLPEIHLTLKDYEEAGGLSLALSNHANKTFEQGLKSDEERRIAEAVFRNLTEISQDGHIIRRTATVAEICEAAAIDPADPQQFKKLVAVLDAFRAEGRSFLMPPSDETITCETRLDISHETLIRQWERLKEWTEDEERLRKIGRMVNAEARRWEDARRKDDYLLSGVHLAEADEWNNRLLSDGRRTQAGPEVLTFLEESQKKRNRAIQAEQKAKYFRRLQIWTLAAILLAFLALSGAVWALRERSQARAAQRQVEDSAAALQDVNQKLRYSADALTETNLQLQRVTTEAKATVARQTLDKAMRVMKDGDVSGSLLWIHHAMRQDRQLGHGDRELVHRFRLTAGMHQLARLKKCWGRDNLLISQVLASPDGSLLMCAGTWNDRGTEKGMVAIWRTGISGNGGPIASAIAPSFGETPFAEWEHEFPVKHASWSPDGRFVVTASGASLNEGEVCLLDLYRPKDKRKALCRGKRALLTAFSGRSDASHFLAVVDIDGTKQCVYVWDSPENVREAADQEAPARLLDFGGTVNAAVFRPPCPDGGDLSSGEEEQFVLAGAQANGKGLAMLTSTEGNKRRDWEHPQAVSCAAFSADGERLATGCNDNFVRVFEMAGANDEPSWKKQHDDVVLQVVFSPDRQYLMSSSRDNSTRIWRAEDGGWHGILQHDLWVYTAQFSPDGRYVITGSRDKTAKVWDVATKSLILPPLNHGAAVQHAYFTADGAHVLTRSWNMVRLWSLESGNPPPAVLSSENLRLQQFAQSRDGRFVGLLADSTEQDACRVTVWDIARGDGDRTAAIFNKAMPHAMQHITISDDGNRLFVAGTDPKTRQPAARIYHLGGGEVSERVLLDCPPVKLSAFLPKPDSPILYTVTEFGGTRPPDADRREDSTQRERTTGGAEASARLEQALTTETMRETFCWLSVWNTDDGNLLHREVVETAGEAKYFTFSRFLDGEQDAQAVLATQYINLPEYGGSAVLWRVSPQGMPKRRYTIRQPGAAIANAAFDRNAERLATTAIADADEIWVWDITGTTVPSSPLARGRHASDLTFIAFSDDPEQKYLVSCSFDNTARVWANPPLDLASGKLEEKLILEHNKRVNHAVFFPEKHLIATSSQDGSTRLWDLQTGELVALFADSGEMVRAAFKSTAQANGSSFVTTLCRDVRGRGLRVKRWNIASPEDAATTFEDLEKCLDLMAARRLVGERMKYLESVDRWWISRAESRSGDKQEPDVAREPFGLEDFRETFLGAYRDVFLADAEPLQERHERDPD